MTPETLLNRCGDATPRDRQNLSRLIAASLGWVAALFAVTFVIKRELLDPGPLLWMLAFVPTVAGVVVLLAYGRYLREADELQRILQLKALALGFGAGWIALCGYPVLERLGAPVIGAGEYVAIMAIFYALGSVVASISYR